MFGINEDNQQVAASAPTAQNPSMLDNFTPQDFHTPDPTNSPQQTTPQDQPVQDNPQADASSDSQQTVEHQLTTDNPFVQNPLPDPVPLNDSDQSSDTTSTSFPPETTQSEQNIPSPFATPVFEPVAPTTTPTDTNTATSDDATDSTVPPVDVSKLASMKQEALGHLEPLVEHLEQSAEEEFRTTMMMIQANDNHTLLEKALATAKKIEDDKARAQAMLDIINEINYFSQN